MKSAEELSWKKQELVNANGVKNTTFYYTLSLGNMTESCGLDGYVTTVLKLLTEKNGVSSMKKCPDPEWYVYIASINENCIKKFNVFHSHNFSNGCKIAFKKYKNTEDIEKEIKNWAMYSFWSKCEYEIVLNHFPGTNKFKEKKIDVYDQLLMNWDSFFKYVLEHKAYFLRKESVK